MSDLLERLFVKAEMASWTSCWRWTAAVDRRGYGRFSVQRRGRRAHRVSYGEAVAKVPDDLVVDHLCKNPGCINPLHLQPVTQRINLHRADSINVAHAAKTHCPAGHAYDERNTRVGIHRTRTGRVYHTRICRACHNARTRARQAAGKNRGRVRR